jgi:hypothetical protein
MNHHPLIATIVTRDLNRYEAAVSTGQSLTMPRIAVQTIGGRHVVFVALRDAAEKFVQRPVELGPLAGATYLVRHGRQPGDLVVTEGSFLLRAESLRLAPSG